VSTDFQVVELLPEAVNSSDFKNFLSECLSGPFWKREDNFSRNFRPLGSGNITRRGLKVDTHVLLLKKEEQMLHMGGLSNFLSPHILDSNSLTLRVHQSHGQLQLGEAGMKPLSELTELGERTERTELRKEDTESTEDLGNTSDRQVLVAEQHQRPSGGRQTPQQGEAPEGKPGPKRTPSHGSRMQSAGAKRQQRDGSVHKDVVIAKDKKRSSTDGADGGGGGQSAKRRRRDGHQVASKALTTTLTLTLALTLTLTTDPYH